MKKKGIQKNKSVQSFGMINMKYNTIFIHVPKTAGISVGRAFLCNPEYIGNHERVNNTYSSQKWNKFMICRNPFDRLISSYEYQKKMANWNTINRFQQRIFLKDEKNQDFSKFVDFIYKNSLLNELHTRPQTHWIYSNGDLPLKNLKIIRFENLQNEINQYFTQIGIPSIEIKEENRSERAPFFEYYSNQTVISQVQELYRHDFQYFGYSPEIKNFIHDTE